MSKKISFEDIVKRLNNIRTDLFLDESTYVGTHYKARFFLADGSELWDSNKLKSLGIL